MVVGETDGWEDNPVATITINEAHARSVWFEKPVTGTQLMSWVALNGVDLVVMRTLTQGVLEERLDAERIRTHEVHRGDREKGGPHAMPTDVQEKEAEVVLVYPCIVERITTK